MTALDREVSALIVQETVNHLPLLPATECYQRLADPTWRSRARELVAAQWRKLEKRRTRLLVEAVGYGWMKAWEFPLRGEQ